MKYLIPLLLCISSYTQAQNTSTLFSFDEYITIVKEQHPISYIANLKLETGEAKIQKAKGNFDPKLKGEISQKNFNGTSYYSYLNSGLVIPSWFGVSFQGGYGNTAGQYLNPESNTPENGLWYGGITLNLGKGLFIDKRRSELKKAKIYANSTQVEKNIILNQLVYDASIAYWNWSKAYNKVLIYKTAVTKSKSRFEGIKESALIGEKATIDTLKALIQLQNRELKLEQSELDLLNKKLFLETFLWQQGSIPLEMDSTLVPRIFSTLKIVSPPIVPPSSFEALTTKHPALIYYKNNIAILKIDYRLKKENLKPTIDLKYNSLSNSLNTNTVGIPPLNNYNWGAKVSYPIFTRKERGQLNQSKLKIKENENQLRNKKTIINYKIKSAYNQWNSTLEQVKIYTKTVENYKTLLESENTLFQIGESSLFLVNYRAQELITAQLKLIDLIAAVNKAKSNWIYQISNFN